MTEAAWINGKRRMTGRWMYHWASDRFEIILDSRDHITGNNRRLVVGGDTPEWGNWKLERPASGIEAASAGETAETGSTEGKSPVRDSADAQTRSELS